MLAEKSCCSVRMWLACRSTHTIFRVLRFAVMALELRLQIRTTLDSLEVRDLSSQAAYGAENICTACSTPQALETFLKEVLGGLGSASPHARRLRFR